jgi:hypothetical protein
MGFHFAFCVTSFAAAAFNATALSKSSPIFRIADIKPNIKMTRRAKKRQLFYCVDDLRQVLADDKEGASNPGSEL